MNLEECRKKEGKAIKSRSRSEFVTFNDHSMLYLLHAAIQVSVNFETRGKHIMEKERL